MADASDRTLPATPRRREAARLQGVVPMAAAPAWIATVAAVVLLLPSWTRATLPAAVSMMRSITYVASGRPAPRYGAVGFEFENPIFTCV